MVAYNLYGAENGVLADRMPNIFRVGSYVDELSGS